MNTLNPLQFKFLFLFRNQGVYVCLLRLFQHPSSHIIVPILLLGTKLLADLRLRKMMRNIFVKHK